MPVRGTTEPVTAQGGRAAGGGAPRSQTTAPQSPGSTTCAAQFVGKESRNGRQLRYGIGPPNPSPAQLPPPLPPPPCVPVRLPHILRPPPLCRHHPTYSYVPIPTPAMGILIRMLKDALAPADNAPAAAPQARSAPAPVPPPPVSGQDVGAFKECVLAARQRLADMARTRCMDACSPTHWPVLTHLQLALPPAPRPPNLNRRHRQRPPPMRRRPTRAWDAAGAAAARRAAASSKCCARSGATRATTAPPPACATSAASVGGLRARARARSCPAPRPAPATSAPALHQQFKHATCPTPLQPCAGRPTGGARRAWRSHKAWPFR